MGMKELKIASYETVKLAVKKGFDWIQSDDKFYDFYGELDYTFQGYKESTSEYSRYPAPSLELLQKWLREEYNVHINIFVQKSIGYKLNRAFYYSVTKEIDDIRVKEVTNKLDKTKEIFKEWVDKKANKSYEEALEFGINEALKLVK